MLSVHSSIQLLLGDLEGKQTVQPAQYPASAGTHSAAAFLPRLSSARPRNAGLSARVENSPVHAALGFRLLF